MVKYNITICSAFTEIQSTSNKFKLKRPHQHFQAAFGSYKSPDFLKLTKVLYD